ncbi:phage tail protein [Vibrio aestuarianus]|uniref:Phage tail protein n=1 Tax=Vibrio aestuarianus TaxID=28171 RepID=A0ABD7YQM0_9VIBR|nr:phage tail protein [Vibrio aestuarianus]WGK87261.1 phage tail protein [Vibrio aestuarianus]CAH8235046.1 conserved hypothetical protein [Vibrio aestuarianus]
MANQDTDLRCYLTNAGIAAENNSIQLGRKLPVKEMVFGSGLLADGSDPRLQTTMIKEEHAVPCGMLFDPESPTLLVFKSDLPADVGGFHIHEVAIRLEDGTLYGYARGKGDYKPTIEQGATDSVRYAVEMYTTNASIVECKIDLSKVYVDWEDLEVRIKAHKSEPEPHSQYHKAEEQRLICLDNYGHTAFVDGFDVTQQADPNKYKITPGVVYVGGLRAVLAGEVLQTITTKPNGIYIDVVRDGAALSAWENTLTIKVSTTPLNDYVDEAGRKHYVAKLAGINANGSVVDSRVKGGLGEHVANSDPHVQYAKDEDMIFHQNYSDAHPQYMKYGDSSASWASMVIGQPFPLIHLNNGVVTPPKDDTNFRFIKLSSNDQYNDGILINEIVTGTAPVLSVTAEINFQGSPLNGQRVELRNTSKLFSRAGENGGVIIGDTIRNITASMVGFLGENGVVAPSGTAGAFETVSSGVNGLISGATGSTSNYGFAFDASNVVPTADQNQPVHIEEAYYMRVF